MFKRSWNSTLSKTELFYTPWIRLLILPSSQTTLSSSNRVTSSSCFFPSDVSQTHPSSSWASSLPSSDKGLFQNRLWEHPDHHFPGFLTAAALHLLVRSFPICRTTNLKWQIVLCKKRNIFFSYDKLISFQLSLPSEWWKQVSCSSGFFPPLIYGL